MNPKRQKLVSRTVRAKPKSVIRTVAPSAIFLSGGIGDVLALESFMSNEERNCLKTIYYGTNKSDFIQNMFCSLPNFPLLKNHEVLWNDFSQFWCFLRKNECLSKMSKNKISEDILMSNDYGIISMFPKIKSGKQFTGSSFLKFDVADIKLLCLPENYYVVCPYSTDKRLNTRDFNESDWNNCINKLKSIGIKGVVLNQGPDIVPNDTQLINMSNSCSLLQAFEILKKSKGYIGIDSALSVLAAQLFQHPNLSIKSQSQHCYDNIKCYYPTQKNMNFISKKIA
jgi:hypothetical protein